MSLHSATQAISTIIDHGAWMLYNKYLGTFHTLTNISTFTKSIFHHIYHVIHIDTIQPEYEKNLIVSALGHTVCQMGENLARDNGESELELSNNWDFESESEPVQPTV